MSTVCGQALEQVVKSCCEVSILKDFQQLDGEVPKYAALIPKGTLF